MTYILYNTVQTTIAFSLLTFAVLLSFFLHKKHRKLQKKQTQKLGMIYDELKLEKSIKKQNRTSSQKISYIEKKTAYRLARIKIDIINISFSYTEIFKNLT